MTETNQDPINRALAVMDAHIRALNERDSKALAATLHFPHYRLSGPRLKVWETSADYFEDFLERAGTEWNRSSFDDIKVLQSSENKVHLDAEIRRFRADGARIATFRSLWVITESNGIWAAKFRSSFAQQ